MDEKSIKQHIAQWLKGNDQAYRKLFDYYYPRLFSACHRSLKQREDCEELVLNVFLKLWQSRNHFAQAQNFENYLFGILRNQMADFLRRQILLTENIDTQPIEKLGIASPSEADIKEIEKIYQRAVLRLPEKQRTVFLMSREDGLSQKLIAERTNISVNTVNNHIKAALKSIRKDMGQFSEVLPLILAISLYV